MYDDGHIATRGNALLVVSIVLLTIPNFASISRLAIRGTKKQLGLDDFVLGLATVRRERIFADKFKLTVCRRCLTCKQLSSSAVSRTTLVLASD